MGCSVARQGPAPLAESHRLLRLAWELCPVVECLSEPRDLSSPVEEGKMREGRLSEALRAVEKPPGTAPGRLTEDGRAVREAQAETAESEQSAPLPCTHPGSRSREESRGPPASRPTRAGTAGRRLALESRSGWSELPEVWAGTPEAWQAAALISTPLD